MMIKTSEDTLSFIKSSVRDMFIIEFEEIPR